MGYKKLIRELIPDDWLVILKEEQAITYYVDTVYASLDPYPRGYDRHLRGVFKRMIIEMMHRCTFFSTVYHSGLLPDELAYWKTLQNKIYNNKRNK